jgi:hypothetical protein
MTCPHTYTTLESPILSAHQRPKHITNMRHITPSQSRARIRRSLRQHSTEGGQVGGRPVPINGWFRRVAVQAIF